MKSRPAGLRRPMGTIACSWEGASQLRWFEVGLAVLGWLYARLEHFFTVLRTFEYAEREIARFLEFLAFLLVFW